MDKTLHILNGDSTAEILERSPISGDVVVWREMFCEGGIRKDVGSDEFWMTRYSFFENKLGVSKLEYYDKTIKEIIKIENISNYNKVVLWFEYDLFCQVNLLALCTYLLKFYRKNIQYYLICTGIEKNKKSLQTLSDYDPEEYKNLFDNKVKLSRNNMLFAEESWGLFVENSKQTLMLFDFKKCSKFKYLQMSIDQHLQRFPKQNGLNQIENKILELINFGVYKERELVKELLLWQHRETIYGFGELQYFLAVKKMEKYYTTVDEIFYLNDKGKEIRL